MHLFNLTGKRALLTGAASGLGLAMARGLREAGASVAIIDVSSETPAVAETLAAPERPACGIVADLSEPDQAERAFHEAVDGLGGLDILVNNVGIVRRGPTEEHSLEDWEIVLRVNVTAAFVMSKLAAQVMLAQGRGKIIHVGSLYSFVGGPLQIGYAATKGAIRTMTMAMSNEWAARGINVNAIAPGYISTPLNATLRADPDWHRRVMDRVPMKRYGAPEELQGTIIYLASAASDYVSGIMLPVDGGFLGR